MNNDRGAALYARFLEGDEAAFEEIMNTYRTSLTFFINRYVNNVDVAEDIAADVFAYIIFKPKKYNFKVTLKTYLYMIGRSRALDWLRKETKRSYIPLYELYHEPTDDERSLEDSVIADEEKKHLHEAMKKLPNDYRIAIHLVYFEDLSYEEAARVMHKNKKQIENLIYRGKKALKSILEEDDDNEK